MNNLPLNSLEIQNYRALRHLKIEKLGRVNLIVGRNNVGKTSVLEAIWIYMNNASPSALFVALNERDEVTSARLSFDERATIQREALKSLFFGRDQISQSSKTAQIGEINAQEKFIRFGIGSYKLTEHQNNEEIISTWRLLTPNEYDQIENSILRLGIQAGSNYRVAYDLTDELQTRKSKPLSADSSIVYMPANAYTSRNVSRLWDQVALTNLEENVLEALKIIEPLIERITLITNPDSLIERIPIVRLRNIENPVPLRSMGDGVNRLFGLALSVVSAKDGVLLLDEIENGLHYSIQPDVWQLIFYLAERLNIQVFATTHSNDCVQAFQQIASEHSEEGMLVRLGRRKGEVVATLFDEDELEVAVREQIEVR